MSVELIKQKIEEIKTIEAANQQKQELYRVRFRRLLLEIENLGGYLALGYKTLTEFYQGEFGDRYSILGTSAHCHNAAMNYEYLLEVPIGHYGYNDLEGIRCKFIYNNQGKGLACSINSAAKIKTKWREICMAAICQKIENKLSKAAMFATKGNEIFAIMVLWDAVLKTWETHKEYLPTGQEIHTFSGSKVKKKLTADKYYRKREEEAKKELEAAKTQITELEEEIKSLKGKLAAQKKKNKELEKDLEAAQNIQLQEEKIPFLSRMRIAALSEERDNLVKENEALKNQLKAFNLTAAN